MPDETTDQRLDRIERDIAALRAMLGVLETDAAAPGPDPAARQWEKEEARMILALLTQIMARIEATVDEPFPPSIH